MNGTTKKCKVRNEDIRDTIRVWPVKNKIR